MVIDIHTHCFPDELAARAIPQLARKAGIPPHTDGTVKALKKSMEEAGIHISVLQPIATKPEQTVGVNRWAISVQNESIISFGTIHPDYPYWRDEIKRLVNAGIRGVKFHPDYQNFFVDEPRLLPIYEEIFKSGMVILFHAGIDIGLPEPCHCTPAMLSNVLNAFPGAPVIAAHMGGYLQWEQVKRHLIGRNVYFDTSYSFADLGEAEMKEIIQAHGSDKILFGTDSPWAQQKKEVSHIRSLDIEAKDIDAILGGNAQRLLNIAISSP